MDEQPSCEPVDLIRHLADVAKGGHIPVCFVDSPSSLPSFLSRIKHDDLNWDVWSDDDEYPGYLEDNDEDRWGDPDFEDYYDSDPRYYGLGLVQSNDGEEFEDGGESDGRYEVY